MKFFLAALAAAFLTLVGHGAHASCPTPNPNLLGPPFVDNCPLPASALNRITASGAGSLYSAFGITCDGHTDQTAAFNALPANTVVYIPNAAQCYINGQVNLKTGTVLTSQTKWPGGLVGGAVFGANYLAYANVVEGPNGTINSGAATQTNNVAGSGIDGLLIVASNYVQPTNLRQAITARSNFVGTAIGCSTPDFLVRNTLVIGFTYALKATATGSVGNGGIQCDRLRVQDFYADSTNGIYGNASGGNAWSADLVKMDHVEIWPYVTYSSLFSPTQSTNISNITSSGGAYEITLSGPPSTAYVTGDVIKISPVSGMPTVNNRWTITVIDTTHFTLNGSTFAGSYSSGGVSYLDATFRTGYGFYNNNSNTGMSLVDFSVINWDTGLYMGTGAEFTTCTNCTIENDDPEGAADPVPIGLDVEGNATGIAMVGGSIISGTAVKNNTTGAYPTSITSVVTGGFVHAVLVETGNIIFTGGTISCGNDNGKVCDLDITNASYTVSLAGGVFVTPGAPFDGQPNNFLTLMYGQLQYITNPASSNPQWIFGQGANAGTVNGLAVFNSATTDGTCSRLSAVTGTSDAFSFLETCDGSSLNMLVQSGSGLTNGIQIQSLAGPIALAPFTAVNINGGLNLTGVTGGGSASKYVCTDSSGNVVVQSGAC